MTMSTEELRRMAKSRLRGVSSTAKPTPTRRSSSPPVGGFNKTTPAARSGTGQGGGQYRKQARRVQVATRPYRPSPTGTKATTGYVTKPRPNRPSGHDFGVPEYTGRKPIPENLGKRPPGDVNYRPRSNKKPGGVWTNRNGRVIATARSEDSGYRPRTSTAKRSTSAPRAV